MGKRKSGAAAAAPAAASGKRRKSATEAPPPAAASGVVIKEGGSFTQLELGPGRSAVLSGCALLEVTAGCLSVYGALITPDSGPVRLDAPARLGRALLLTAVGAPPEPVPPRSPAPWAPAATAVLQPGEGPAAAASAAAAQAYSVTDAASPDAPQAWSVPAAWSEAAQAIAAAAHLGGEGTATDADGAAPAAQRPLVVAVTGSKGAGKSGFARLLVNALLSASSSSSSRGSRCVAFLDLDPGQPELSPPGLLSLHLLRQPLLGPAHLQLEQPSQPLLAFFQGDVSSQGEPGRYLQAAHALCSCYYGLAAGADAGQGTGDCLPPLVINTPGWITGLGLDLLGEVLRCAQPTHVVQLQAAQAKRNLPGELWWLEPAPQQPGVLAPVLLPLAGLAATTEAAAGATAAPSLSGQSGDTLTGTTTTAQGGGSGRAAAPGRGLSAVESRALMWLAWARRVAAAHPSSSGGGAGTASGAAAAAAAGPTAADAAAADEFAEAAAGLAAAVPHEAALRELRVELLAGQVQPSQLGAVLNGAIVGLAAGGAAAAAADEPGAQLAPPRPCLGLGLVRAVDARAQRLHLLTDVAEGALQGVDTLLLGRLELPDRLLEGRGFAAPYQSLFCLAATATGAGAMRSRNNLLRPSRLLGGAAQ